MPSENLGQWREKQDATREREMDERESLGHRARGRFDLCVGLGPVPGTMDILWLGLFFEIII